MRRGSVPLSSRLPSHGITARKRLSVTSPSTNHGTDSTAPYCTDVAESRIRGFRFMVRRSLYGFTHSMEATRGEKEARKIGNLRHGTLRRLKNSAISGPEPAAPDVATSVFSRLGSFQLPGRNHFMSQNPDDRQATRFVSMCKNKLPEIHGVFFCAHQT